MKRRILDIMIVSVLMAVSASCALEETFEPAQTGFDGTANLSLQIDYRPMSSALDTKSDGKLISGIDNLSIIVYHADGVFHSYYYYGTLTGQQNIDVDDEESLMGAESPDALQTNESKYQRTTINDISLVNGNFRIYAVANLDRELTEDERKTEDALKAVQLTWDYKLPSGTTDPTPNATHHDVMFGFFTDTEVTEKEITDAAPIISINKADKQLHAWVRRAASKVTVSFDASGFVASDGSKYDGLNEDVWIYLKSVQIKDIPTNCPLGEDNTPTSTDQLMDDGEILYFSDSDDYNDWPVLTAGTPTYYYKGNTSAAAHSESAPALYFFENMQGVDAADTKIPQDLNNDGVVDEDAVEDFKDKKLYGTYIEVKGYYINKTAATASRGAITYRFMLGKNVTNDYDAERNNHYKVTLKFKNDANNPDWHIEYEAENPEISVPTPLYISYLHNEKLELPVTVHGGTIQSVTAQIIENKWYYDEPDLHPMYKANSSYYDSKNGGSGDDFNGFLTLNAPDGNNGNSRWVDSDRIKLYFGSANNKVHSKTFYPKSNNDMSMTIPVYTRGLQLGGGYSGSNIYMNRERRAVVKITAEILKDDGKTVVSASETVEIKQVKRVVNPAGIWRPAEGSNATLPFHVILMEGRTDADTFDATVSDGPWTAKVIEGDWALISKDGTSYGYEVHGNTNTKVDFFYKPSSAIGKDQSRCGVIEILYHSNNCKHYIFVSQGLASLAMAKSKTKWHMTNVHCKGQEETSPLAEGSLFRFRNLNAILASNNFRTGFGVDEPLADRSGAIAEKLDILNVDGASAKASWPLANDGYDTALGSLEDEYTLGIGKHSFENILDSGDGEVAKCTQWAELQELPRYFGVMYGEYSSEVKKDYNDAYQYLNDKDDKGMRGMFVWDRKASEEYTPNYNYASANGNHLFFPVGATGHGHRFQVSDWGLPSSYYQKIGTLRYSTMDNPLGSLDRPLLDDLYLSEGAIYWCRDWIDQTKGKSGQNMGDEADPDRNAQDINYHTYDFNTYFELAIWFNKINSSGVSNTTYVQSSDACLIRCVDN